MYCNYLFFSMSVILSIPANMAQVDTELTQKGIPYTQHITKIVQILGNIQT